MTGNFITNYMPVVGQRSFRYNSSNTIEYNMQIYSVVTY